ncbi:MAG TPA: hypothetical protein VEH31_25815 [Streptosporangiaceae bacterium]|nr:hypothetical protein [Streptosporangiaceae bacterium]HYA49880.1 hypothetical protein [Streptosporangiaceae bacterium]
MNHGGGEPSLASLIERSAELKRTLVDFALSPRFGRHLGQFMLEAVDPSPVIGARLSELVRR